MKFKFFKRLGRVVCDWCLGRATRKRRKTDWGFEEREDPSIPKGYFRAVNGKVLQDQRQPSESVIKSPKVNKE